MTIRNVLVLGASGDQGIPLVNSLQRRGFAVAAGARRPDAMAGTPFPDTSPTSSASRPSGIGHAV